MNHNDDDNDTLSSTTYPTPLSSLPFARAEELASEVVQHIEKLVDHLRSTTTTTTTGTTTTGTNALVKQTTVSQRSYPKNVRPNAQAQRAALVASLCDSSLYQKIQQTCDKVAAAGFTNHTQTNSDLRQEEKTDASIISDPRTPPAGQEVAWLLDNLLLPLCDALASCYRILDQWNEHDASEQAPSSSSSQSKAHPPFKHSSHSRHHKPRPPPGLLSLAQYTNVACLLELTVCLGILPHLSSSWILAPIDQRVCHLPKSLAGRMPRQCLLLLLRNPISTTTQDALESNKKKDDNNNNNNSHHNRTTLATLQAAESLQRTADSLGQVLFLDRFRPMLLPRHVADVYAAVFQADEFRRQVQALQQRRRNQDGGSGEATATTTTTTDRTIHSLVTLTARHSTQLQQELSQQLDACPILQARAYQTLLVHGTKAPLWLRRRVSHCLNDLAIGRQQLSSAIVVVFVQADRDVSAASVRLARTLANEVNHNVTQQLVLMRQVVRMMDDMMMTSEKGEEAVLETLGSSGWTPNQQATLCTIWALLTELLPNPVLEQELLQSHFVNDATNKVDGINELYPVIRRFGILLSNVPPFANIQHVLSLFLLQPVGDSAGLNERGTDLTLLGACLRMMTTVYDSEQGSHISSLQFSRSRKFQDAQWTLRLLIRAVVSFVSPIWESNESSPIRVEDVLVTAMIYTLAPTQSDWNHYAARSQAAGGSLNPLETLTSIGSSMRHSETGDCSTWLVRDIESRARALFAVVLDLDSGSTKEKGRRRTSVPSKLFYLLVSLYVGQDNDCRKYVNLPEIFRGDQFHLVSLVALPLLCEDCPPEHLLDSDGTVRGILQLMKLVFASVAVRLHRSDHVNRVIDGATTSFAAGFPVAGKILARRLRSSGDPINQHAFGFSEGGCGEVITSVCSILLSLLVAMLELGAEKRSVDDEEMIRSLMKVLEDLADTTPAHMHDDPTYFAVPVEITQMASHALALVAARQTEKNNEGSPERDTLHPQEEFPSRIEGVERDLASTEPPIRARAVVTLRHLACHICDTGDGDQPTVWTDVKHQNPTEAFWRILRLTIDALADLESYVYLAAVQTLATMADAKPQQTIPSLAGAVAFGKLQCADGVEKPVSDEQRIKLAEGLISIVRRKASIREFYSDLIQILIFGGRDRAVSPSTDGGLIQEQTHKYFIRGNHPEEDESNQTLTEDEKWELIETRINTGGPIFQSEESDLVRAGRISVLAEIVSVANLHDIARYAHIFVECSIYAIQLDNTRPVRRAGGLLARALYEALLREPFDLQSPEGADVVVLARALATADEKERLAPFLHRCIQANDLDDLPDEKKRYWDPATIARCEEALSFRKEADDAGILAAGRLAHSMDTFEGQNPIIATLREPTRSSAYSQRQETSLGVSRLIEEL